MAYFPFYMDLSGKKGVILGGGRVASGKLKTLLAFGPEMVCISPVICEEIERMAAGETKNAGAVRLVRREAVEAELEGAFFVIAATDRREINDWASALCRKKGIPVNAADDRKNCTFYFPALAHDGPVTVGISTGGCSPAAAAWLRGQVQRMLPEGLGDMVERLGRLREAVLERVPDQKQRAAILTELFLFCEKKQFQAEEGDLEEYLSQLLGKADRGQE